ncbi:hypothetical protein [Thalassiella azotivora]
MSIAQRGPDDHVEERDVVPCTRRAAAGLVPAGHYFSSNPIVEPCTGGEPPTPQDVVVTAPAFTRLQGVTVGAPAPEPVRATPLTVAEGKRQYPANVGDDVRLIFRDGARMNGRVHAWTHVDGALHIVLHVEYEATPRKPARLVERVVRWSEVTACSRDLPLPGGEQR